MVNTQAKLGTQARSQPQNIGGSINPTHHPTPSLKSFHTKKHHEFHTQCAKLIEASLQNLTIHQPRVFLKPSLKPSVFKRPIVKNLCTLRNVVIKAHFEVGRTYQTQWKHLVHVRMFGSSSTPLTHTNNLVKGKCAKHTIGLGGMSL